MAIRNVRTEDNPVLREKCLPVKEVTDATRKILADMMETMYEYDGVGLAGPQIGIAKRLVVIDDHDGHIYKLVNPEIVKKEGEQLSQEGCLSLPGFSGRCKRPEKVWVESLNENGEKISFVASGLLAVICCHEFDHLDGILYKDVAFEYGKNEQN